MNPLDYFTEEEIKDFKNFDALTNEMYEKGAFDIEIIYYHTAMDFLTKNDPSLTESLSIASEMGYDVKNLNSEVLASVLASDMAKNEWNELEMDITEKYYE